MKKIIRKLFKERYTCIYCREEKGFFDVLCKKCDCLYDFQKGKKLARMVMLHRIQKELFVILRDSFLKDLRWTNFMETTYKSCFPAKGSYLNYLKLPQE